MADCALVIVECCQGMIQRPAHGCNSMAVCACKWTGDYYSSRLQAQLEWDRHVGIRGSVQASARLAGREIPAGYSRSPAVQQLLDKLQQLHDKRR